MIKCSCKSCGKRFNVPPAFAGRKGKCPDCKQIVFIPQADQAAVVVLQEIETTQKIRFDESLIFTDTSQSQRTDDGDCRASTAVNDIRMFGQQNTKTSSQDDPDRKRKFAWPIDIFLYPTSAAGLTQLAIFLGIPFLIGVLTLILGPFGIFIGIPGIVIMLIIDVYMAWYVCECVRDSGYGGVRAPDVINRSPDPLEAVGQLFRIVACYAFFLAPIIVYLIYTKRFDGIFWVLGGYAAFVFPMGLLAVTMYDSLHGLNPILLIGSIVRVFFSYCILVMAMAAADIFIWYLSVKMRKIGLPTILIRTIITYLILVAAHLLGRFYYWKADKLNWEV